MITCAICNKQFNMITARHLSSHGITLSEYKRAYPNHPTRSDDVIAKMKAASSQSNKNRVGVKRSADIIAKIKRSKQDNPLPAWNKGIPRSSEQKQHQSAVKKLAYQSGDLPHWNTGNITSVDTKLKISNTLLQQHLHYSPVSLEKRTATIKIKKDRGWVKPNTYVMTAEHKEAFLSVSIANNNAKTQVAVNKAIDICNKANIRIQSIEDNSYQYNLICNVCSTSYARTKNAFVPCKVNNEAYLCPTCYPRLSVTSAQEQHLYDFVKGLDNSAINGDRLILNGREIDIMIPPANVGIEYNGLYWHSEAAGGKDSNYHLWKSKLAYSKDIRLVSIFEDEWLKNPMIVKSRLTHILHQTPHNVHARKCIIIPINNKTKNEFLHENHIQGADVSSIRFGAYHNDQLVAVMTFTELNMSKGSAPSEGHYELNRFAVKNFHNVPGVSSRLFNKFISQYNPLLVISYSDRRWCSGGVYKKLGFVFEKATPPSYWYLVDNYTTRKHRSNFMKHKLKDKLSSFDPELTEWQNMVANGYDRIWDCGTLKFVWTK